MLPNRVLLLSASFVLFFALFRLPLIGLPNIFQVSEGREGVVAARMQQSGELVLPLRHGTIIPSKPPLFHWMVLGISRVTNQLTEFELRLPSLLAAAALAGTMLIFVLQLLPTLSGRTTIGLLAVLILTTTWGFHCHACDGRVDMLFCFLSSGAIFLWLTNYEVARVTKSAVFLNNRFGALLFGLMLGTATLTKGPLGVLLPFYVGVVVILSDWLAERLRVCNSRELGSTQSCVLLWRSIHGALLRWECLLAAVVVALPWYSAAYFKGGEPFLARVFFENMGRFAGDDGITVKPWYFYFEQIWLHSAPWSFILLAFGIATRFRKRAGYSQEESRLLFLSGVWIAAVVLFLSISAGKRAAYLLLILPPLSILAAVWFAPGRYLRQEAGGEDGAVSPGEQKNPGLTVESHKSWVSFLRWAWLTLLVVLLAFAVSARAESILPTSLLSQRMVRATIDAYRGSERGIISVAVIILLIQGSLLFCSRFLRKADAASQVLFRLNSIWCLLQFVLVPVSLTLVAGKGISNGYKQAAADISSLLSAEESIHFIKRRNDESFDGFFFYVGRNIPLFEIGPASEQSQPPEERGLYLSRSSWLDGQSASWKERTEILYSGGRRKDQQEDNVVLFRLKDEAR